MAILILNGGIHLEFDLSRTDIIINASKTKFGSNCSLFVSVYACLYICCKCAIIFLSLDGIVKINLKASACKNWIF